MTTVTIIENKPSFWQRTKQKLKHYAVSTATAFGVATTAVTATVTPNIAYAALDVAPVTQEISGNSQSVQTIMLAVLAIAALFVGFMFIKRALR